MDSDIKKFLRHSSNYALGELLAFSVSFISFPVLTRALTTSDYGIMSVFSVTLWIFLAFSRAGLAESTVRFYREYHSANDPVARSTYYSTFFFGTLAFALVTALFVVLFGKEILTLIFGRELPGFHWILAGMILNATLYSRLLNFYRASQRTVYYNTAMVTVRFFSLAVSIAVLFLIAKDVKVYYQGILAAEALMTLVLLVLFLKETPLSIKHFSSPFLKSCLAFGFPLIGFELGYLLLKSVDRYIIQFMLGSEAVGIFSVASNMGHYTKDLILFPLMYALTPIYIEIWHDKGEEATSKFVSTVANISVLVLIPIFFITSFLGSELIVVLASDKFAQAGNLLGWIVAGTLLWALLPIYASGLYIAKKTRIISVTVLFCVVIDVVLNIVLIKYFGLVGSCYAALISCALLAAFLSRISSKYLKVRVQFKTLLVSLAASALIYGGVLLLPHSTNFFGVIFKMGVLFLIYSIMVLLLHREIRKYAFVAAEKIGMSLKRR